MIILIIAFFVITTFVSFFYIRPRGLRLFFGSLSLLLLAGSLVMITANFTHHWGMNEVTTTRAQKIYTAGPTTASYGMLIKHEIGNGSGNYVFVYRSKQDDKAPQAHFVPDRKNIIDAVKKTAIYRTSSRVNHAEVRIHTTHYQFSSTWARLLFGIGGGNNELQREIIVVVVPSDTWLVITPNQAKELEQRAPQLEAQQKALLADQVKAQLAQKQAQLETEAAKAPTPAEQAQIPSKLAAAEEAAKEQATKQAQDPKVQVKAIKKMMGW